MTRERSIRRFAALDRLSAAVVVFLCVLMLVPPEAVEAAVTAQAPAVPELPVPGREMPGGAGDRDACLDAEALVRVPEEEADTVRTVVVDPKSPYGLDGKIKFNPKPERAVWLSALFPGLGQIYNRRYWKLPIIVGGFMGLGYATTWNNSQLQDYSQGYRDLLDNDPSTDSYMNFFLQIRMKPRSTRHGSSPPCAAAATSTGATETCASSASWPFTCFAWWMPT